jgi:gluconate 5-dehydrogenase
MNLFSLKSKVILVTGGYGYLATGFCLDLAKAGAIVIIAAKNRDKFQEKYSDVKNIFFCQCDVSSTKSIKKALVEISHKYSRLDVLINNAFYLKHNPDPLKIIDDDFNYGLDGILTSTYRVVRESLPFLQSPASIINLASMYGIVAPDFKIYNKSPQFINPPHYGAAKAGIIQLTKYFAVLLAKQNIRVNVISPGAYPSKIVQQNRYFIKNLESKIPLGRIGRPDDLSGPIIFLASDASRYITGHNLIVDGGWTVL